MVGYMQCIHNHASNMFVSCNVPHCQSLIRNVVYKFTVRIDDNHNSLLCAIRRSDMRRQ